MGMVTDHPTEVWLLSRPVDAELESSYRWMITVRMVDDGSGDGG